MAGGVAGELWACAEVDEAAPLTAVRGEGEDQSSPSPVTDSSLNHSTEAIQTHSPPLYHLHPPERFSSRRRIKQRGDRKPRLTIFIRERHRHQAIGHHRSFRRTAQRVELVMPRR